ncbi:MAG: hypothetical protein B7Y31_06930 [Novosphingobium sp. 16-62-11]|uniref:hypothetical protein n=1 Tax=Novosphingobium sp. 17-62-19 TaxID=1970406 RepID=UPI000BCD455E|nr:hypothetical protein [Novosphingobium sp. 17-62-19]OYX91681.1 MAG: hypothetical protein B7Y74_13910 [Novosphingobium sp. 35-62-5]OYZ40230.1 MAG: hypothetical protein B7Y31_06930 [Novosphingobium sp. 16-62-11]OZA18213.1 MAG: hypothetical protein B7X90_12605 [Novosphingobium sp. 17-62-19]HQS96110.1 hypothetical protein [Novosphingobium sp.]
MTLEEANQTLRSGDGDIRPIIDWLHDEDATVLLPLLLDAETRTSVLYILSELPARRIPAPLRAAIREMMPGLDGPERLWAEEVLSDFCE